MANRPEFATPDNWATYFHTADINATVSAVTAEAGTPVWHQLTTRDYRAAVDLPRDLWGGRPSRRPLGRLSYRLEGETS
jgi:uncharacterized protein